MDENYSDRRPEYPFVPDRFEKGTVKIRMTPRADLAAARQDNWGSRRKAIAQAILGIRGYRYRWPRSKYRSHENAIGRADRSRHSERSPASLPANAETAS